MKYAGLDTSVWASHSTRSAAAVYRSRELTCIQLLKLADWSLSGEVYKKFYERYI